MGLREGAEREEKTDDSDDDDQIENRPAASLFKYTASDPWSSLTLIQEDDPRKR